MRTKMGFARCTKVFVSAPVKEFITLLPTLLRLLLSRRLKILLKRFIRLRSFANYTKRILKLISISIQSYFNSSRLNNPFGQRALRLATRAKPTINIGVNRDSGPRKARS